MVQPSQSKQIGVSSTFFENILYENILYKKILYENILYENNYICFIRFKTISMIWFTDLEANKINVIHLVNTDNLNKLAVQFNTHKKRIHNEKITQEIKSIPIQLADF